MFRFKHLVFFVTLLFVSSISAYEYAFDAKMSSNPKIKNFHIFSERSSGSNFFHCLVNYNFLSDDEPLTENLDFGHKHFPLWFEIAPGLYPSPDKKYHFKNNENTLFLVIFRNPYDWLRSFAATPFCADKSLIGVNFSEFIRSPWIYDQEDQWMKIELADNPFVDLNPLTLQPFDNVMRMRSAKIRTMLDIKDRVENIYYIQYETLRDHPKEVLEEIASLYNLQNQEVYKPVVHHKGNSSFGEYKEKTYLPINQEDLLFINDQLDEELENEIGYHLFRDVKDIK